MMIQAVIFDMDGVLVDAEDWHYDALNRALRLFGYEINRYNHLTTYNGLPTKKKLEMLSVESGLPRELHAFINEMKQIYTMELIHAKCRPNFLHQYALSTLKSLNYKLAVASNSIRTTVEIMMQKVRLFEYLDSILSSSDVSHPKPDAEIYLKSIENLDVNPQQCLIIEDNEHGVKSAIAAGAHVLRVDNISQVNLENILARIKKINEENF